MILDGVLERTTVEDRVREVAGGLLAKGVGRGDRVAWQLPNRTDAIVLYRACWRIGATAVPMHHLAGASERAAILSALAPTLVVDGDSLPTGAAITEPNATPDDIAVILHTSGSSGTPKGVRHTQGALAYKAKLMAGVHELTPDDAVLMPAPLAHISGLLNGVLVPGAVPMKCVLMERWDPDVALDLIEAERITFMIGPPTFFVGLMQAPSFASSRVASLRLISSGGAGVTPAFVERASSTLGCVVKRTYGSTEAPTITTSRPGDDPAKARDTDGRPVGDVELRVDLATGELQVRGSELFVGYTDPAQTEAAYTEDGWFRTGDVATIDDGWLTIVGRIKDIIIRGGENISAAEVEAALEAHPAVHQAVAVGEPDDRLGERVVAVVVAPGGFDLNACTAWFEEQGIARFKTPERVVVVESLPVLASGKPDRTAIRSMV